MVILMGQAGSQKEEAFVWTPRCALLKSKKRYLDSVTTVEVQNFEK